MTRSARLSTVSLGTKVELPSPQRRETTMKKKNIKNGYRIGIETKKGIKLSRDQYTLGDALEIMYKASFPCILCDHIGTPVQL